MEKKYEDVLRIIYEVGRTPIPPTDIGMAGKEKEKICEWLTDNGYIENVHYRGMFNITCDITPKTLDYFLDKGSCLSR